MSTKGKNKRTTSTYINGRNNQTNSAKTKISKINL